MKDLLEQELTTGQISISTIEECEKHLSSATFNRYKWHYVATEKNSTLAWLLWMFAGRLQFHLFYLGLFNRNHKSVLRIIGLVLMLVLVGFVILVPLWVYDASKMKRYIEEANNIVKAKLLISYLTIEAEQIVNDQLPAEG